MKLKTSLMAAAAAFALFAAVPAPDAHAGASPYVGDIMTVGFNFCPRGWTEADGKLLPINQWSALFSLYGTMYGGDGRSTFGVPDFRGRVAMSMGTGPGLTPRQEGQKGGSETNTLIVNNMPNHNHLLNTTETTPNTHDPNGAIFGTFPGSNNIYTNNNPAINHQMAINAVTKTGGGQPVNNMQPFQVINFCVALEGVYPSRN